MSWSNPWQNPWNNQASSQDPIVAVQREVENARRRLQHIGEGDLADPKYHHSPLTRILETILRPSYGSMNLIKESMFKDERPIGQDWSPLSAYGRGFSLQNKTIGKDIMRKMGVSEEPLFEASLFKDRLKIAPSKAGIYGLMADVLNPTDPLNWLTFGVGKTGLHAGKKGAEILPLAFGKQASDNLTSILGHDALKDVTAQNVDELANKVIAGSPKEVKKRVIQEIHQGMLDAKTSTRTKLPGISDKRSIRTRMTVPFTNTHIADIPIPGSGHLVRAITSMGNRAAKTGVGDKLGRSFSTKFIPQTVPSSVFLRVLSGDIKPGDQLWENTVERLSHELHLSAGAQEYQKFKEGVYKVFETGRKNEDQWRLNVEFIFQGLSIKDKKDIMRYAAEGTPWNQVPNKLQPTYRAFQGWKGSIIKEYHKMGIPVKELDNYVPHIVVGGRLTKEESRLLTSVFGQSSRQAKEEGGLWDAAVSADPNLLERRFNATPEQINKVLGREWLTEDAAVAMAMRGARFLKAKDLVVFLRGSIEKYGLTIADVKRIREGITLPKSAGQQELKNQLSRLGIDPEAIMAHRNLPEGYAFYRVQSTTGGRLALQKVDDLSEQKAKGAFALPEEFGRAFNDYVDLHFNPTAGNAIERLVDQFTAGFRMVAYMWNPGHIPRDAYSNIALSWIAGLRNPLVYATAWKLYKPLEHQGAKEHSIFVKALNREASGEELFEKARDLGVVDTGQALGETPMSIKANLGGRQWYHPLKYSESYTKLMIDSTRMVDNYTRFALFIDSLNKGMNLEQAATHVKKHLFDYFDLTPFERKWMRRILPFYTWMRKNIPLQIEQTLKQPGKLATFAKYHRAMSEDDEWVDPGVTPSWAQRGMAINLPGNLTMMSNLPYADLAHLPISQESGRQFLSNINPLFRYLPEVALGQEAFSGMPLEWYPGEKTHLPVVGPLAERIGIDMRQDMIPRRTVGHAAYQIPFVRNLDTMLSSDNDRSFARLMSFLGGPPFYSDERLAESQTYEERDRLRAVIRMLIDAGYDVPDTRELNRMMKGWGN